MIALRSYEEVLKYVNRLGFAGRGNKQAVANAICSHAGITGKWEQGNTIQVKFEKSWDKNPWNGVFHIVRTNGDLVKIAYVRHNETWSIVSYTPKESVVRRPKKYRVEDCGVEHPQYFSGRGVNLTEWEQVFVGAADTAHDAFEDALEQAALTGWDVSRVKNRLSDISQNDENTYHYVAFYVK